MAVRRINGSWYIDFRNREGVRIRKRVDGTKRDAERVLASEKAKDLEGRMGMFTTSRSFKDLTQEYMRYSKANKAASSVELDEKALERLQKRLPVDAPISRITPALMLRFIEARKKDKAARKGGKLSVRTINIDIVIIKAALNKAVEWGWIPHSPLSTFKKLKGESSGRLRFLSQDEVRALLAISEGSMRNMFIVFLGTGMRRGELVNLQWIDVDLQRRMIRVGPDAKTGFTTKNRRERFIPMSNEVHKALKTERRLSRGNYVFVNGNGNQWNNNLPRTVKKIFKKAGIIDASIHTLRHTFASHLAMQGVDIPSIQKLMGHASISVTMRYSHLSPEHLRDSIMNLNFTGAASTAPNEEAKPKRQKRRSR